MKKVMFVIGGLANGGAERVITSISSAIAERGYDVVLLTYYKSDNEYSYSSKIKRICLADGYYDNYIKMSTIKKIRNIRKIIKKEKPDEIICFLSNPSVYVFLSTIFTKYRKKISFAIRANPKVEKGKIAKFQKIFSRYVKNIIVQNKGQITCFSLKVQNKIVVIPNPMYDELFEKEKAYSHVPTKIVSVGRLTDQKNYDLAIEVFNEIHKTNFNIEYYIYGVGNKEEYLQNKINELKLNNSIKLMGFENDRNLIYLDKDIYLMTSKYEGMPNTLAEAMCMGVPSISTNCEFGPSDLIMNENMGILVNDYECATLVKAIEKIINNYQEYVDKARYAKKVLRDTYSYEKIIQKWIDFINK